MVAPHPPDDGRRVGERRDAGADRPATRRTSARCTPRPRPWTRRTSEHARARGTRAGTPRPRTATSRGAKACRSSSPLIGSSKGSPSSSHGRLRARRRRARRRRSTPAGTRSRPAPGACTPCRSRPRREPCGSTTTMGQGETSARGERAVSTQRPPSARRHHLADVAAEDEQRLRHVLAGRGRRRAASRSARRRAPGCAACSRGRASNSSQAASTASCAWSKAFVGGRRKP